MYKNCIHCHLDKNINNFSLKKGSRDGHDSRCKNCCALYHRQKYLNETPEETFKRRQRDALYRKNFPNSIKNSKLKCRYGITLEDKNKMFEKQEGKCAICNRMMVGKICVDHDHQTGKIRSLLCNGCNAGLGHFGDNIEIMQSAIDYVKKWNSD